MKIEIRLEIGIRVNVQQKKIEAIGCLVLELQIGLGGLCSNLYQLCYSNMLKSVPISISNSMVLSAIWD